MTFYSYPTQQYRTRQPITMADQFARLMIAAMLFGVGLVIGWTAGRESLRAELRQKLKVTTEETVKDMFGWE